MQINRMFEIIYLLLEKKSVTAKELAVRFEVSQRTIYRDIEALSAAGIPVYMSRGKGGGISIMDHFVLNKTVLTKEEQGELLSAVKAAGSVNFNMTASALKKLESLFGEHNSNWIEIDFSSWNNSKKEAETFYQIKEAVLSKKTITFTYMSSTGEKTVREAEPLKLYFKGMSRYVYAYCLLRQDFRFFKLSRIRKLSVTEKHFNRELPAGPLFSELPASKKEPCTLKLKFSPEMAFRIYDEFDQYHKEPDGSFIVEVSFPTEQWLISYITSFGSSCEVLEPAEFRDRIKEEFQKAINNYK